MAADKKRKLEMTIAALQERWGAQAIRRLRQGQTSSTPCVPTGFPALDEALAIGGLPRGRISEIIGTPTSGTATIALKIVANAQEQAGTAIYVDLGHTFDPDYAVRCGLELDQLVLVRPYDTRQALAILGDFVIGGTLTSILVFETPFGLLAEPQSAQALATTLDRLIAPLGRTSCALLFLTSLPANNSRKTPPEGSDPGEFGSSLARYPAGSTIPHHAAVRLFIQRGRWIYKQRDICGYQARVLVVKNKLGPAGQQVMIAITFNDNVADNVASTVSSDSAGTVEEDVER